MTTAADTEPASGTRRVTRWQRAVKRTIDVAIAVPALVVTLPVAAMIGVAIVISSGRPVFYRSERIGRGGTPFQILKFRTMVNGTDEEIHRDETAFAAFVKNGYKLGADDPRITPIGRLLRRTSVDEMPQFLNVLVGEMSIVGVRPLVADELAERTRHDVASYQSMRPGLTGLWQVEGRARVVDHERLDLDRRYLDRWSLRLDLRILARTPAAVLRVWQTH